MLLSFSEKNFLQHMPRQFRAAWHNYSSRCIYLITINKAPGIGIFCHLAGDYRLKHGTPGCSYVIPTDIGKAIKLALRDLPVTTPGCRVLQYSIMPDHLHFLLFIETDGGEPLGRIIARFKVMVNTYAAIQHVFDNDFNDQILKPTRKLQVIYDYIRDNPRRLAIRRAIPDFFRRINALTIGGKTYQAYGNLQLLSNPFKEQVVVHRADGVEVRERMREMWLYAAANGGVLVSPFISPAEKEIRAAAEEMDGRVILITHMPFGERYKPHAHDFDLCCRGLLLIIAPTEPPVSDELSRSARLTMNALAATICDDGQ